MCSRPATEKVLYKNYLVTSIIIITTLRWLVQPFGNSRGEQSHRVHWYWVTSRETSVGVVQLSRPGHIRSQRRCLIRCPSCGISFFTYSSQWVLPLNVLGPCRVDILGTSWDQCRVSTVHYCFTSTETMRLVRTDSPGRTLRTPLSGTCLLKEVCRKPLFGVCPGRPPRLSYSSWKLWAASVSVLSLLLTQPALALARGAVLRCGGSRSRPVIVN